MVKVCLSRIVPFHGKGETAFEGDLYATEPLSALCL